MSNHDTAESQQAPRESDVLAPHMREAIVVLQQAHSALVQHPRWELLELLRAAEIVERRRQNDLLKKLTNALERVSVSAK
jgi:hypothetical protein